MRLLIYGAGNIGRFYAARLAQASHDVTILARGKRLEQIQDGGITLKDVTSSTPVTTSVRTIEHLAPDDTYDLVLVVLPKHRIAEVLPVVAANDSPSVMFFGNNAAGPDELIAALGSERVLLGFPGAAAIERDGVLHCIVTSKREQPTTIGELDGRRSVRIVELAGAFEAAGFPTSVCPNMDAWLKTHVAKILPSVCALYRAGDIKRLATDDESLRLLVRSIREGFEVLKAMGVPITPSNHKVLAWLPEGLLVFLMKRMVNAKGAAVKFGHAWGGRPEWQQLADEFRTLTDRAQVPTPTADILYRHLESTPTVQPSEASSRA